MALTTLTQIKALLGISSSNASQDPWLDALRGSAETVIKRYVKRDLESQSYTQFYYGNGMRKLALNQRPVTAVTSVWLDNQGNYGLAPSGITPFDTLSLLSPGGDYTVEWDDATQTVSSTACLIRLNTVWDQTERAYFPGHLTFETGPAFGNIKVQYTAGYTSSTLPSDITWAVAMLVAAGKKNLPMGGIVSGEKIGDYSYRMETPEDMYGRMMDRGLPELGDIRQILATYRELPWGA